MARFKWLYAVLAGMMTGGGLLNLVQGGAAVGLVHATDAAARQVCQKYGISVR